MEMTLKKYVIFKFIILILIFFTSGCVKKSIINMQDQIDFGKEQGNKIIEVIENYKIDNGVFPDNLEQLIPMYINEFPKTLTGSQYKYRKDALDDYYLSFMLVTEEKIKSSCTYIRSLHAWDCSFGVQ